MMPAADQAASHRILIIDDNPAIHEDFRKVLGGSAQGDPAYTAARDSLFGPAAESRPQARFEMDSADQGALGVERAREALRAGRPYALAFVDVRMPPGLDGLETIGRLWEVDPDLQIVLCTAYSDYSWAEIQGQVRQYDNLVILKKPFDNIEVMQLAHAMTAKWQLSQDIRRQMETLDELVHQRTREVLAANEGLRREIGERTAAEQQLRASEAQNRALISAIPDLIFSNHKDGEFLSCHASDPRQLILPPEAFLFRKPHEVLPAPLADQFVSAYQSALGSGAMQEFTYALPIQGEERHFEARVVPCTEDSVITIVRDITGRKQAEGRQRQLQDQLAQSQKMESLGLLAGGVAHDMNNVLAAILLTASVSAEMEPAGSRAASAFENISKAAVRGGDMVKGLLNLARQNPAREELLDLNAIISEEVQLLEHTTLARIQVETHLAQDLLPIRGDASALAHTFMNLFVNSLDAMPEHGRLSVRTRNLDGGWIEALVEDSGTGMTREVLARATEPFFTTKTMGKGTGLGLSMAYSTVKAHGGRFELQSRPGQGTRVGMRFPACAAGFQEPESGPLSREPAPGGLSVFLVDDDELIQISMKMSLETMGHTVTMAPSGEEALARLEAGLRPDVIILDMNMPGIGGGGTLPLLRQHYPTVPVLLATGRVDQTVLKLLQAHPQVTLMAKPFSQEKLRLQLEQLKVHRA